jgi:hypothetical protein
VFKFLNISLLPHNVWLHVVRGDLIASTLRNDDVTLNGWNKHGVFIASQVAILHQVAPHKTPGCPTAQEIYCCAHYTQ